MQVVVRRSVVGVASFEDGLAVFAEGQSVPPFSPSAPGAGQLFVLRPSGELSRFAIPLGPRESPSLPGMKGLEFRPELGRVAPGKWAAAAAVLASLKPAPNQASMRLEIAIGSPRMESSPATEEGPMQSAYVRRSPLSLNIA
jgi:hypothetical protein